MATILPDSRAERGWICPRCERGIGPQVTACPCRGEPYLPGLLDPYPERRAPSYCWRSWPPQHTDTCGCRDVIVVPPGMRDAYDKVMRFGTEWTDVMPGLQVRAREINAKDGWMRADFRLTPQDGSE